MKPTTKTYNVSLYMAPRSKCFKLLSYCIGNSRRHQILWSVQTSMPLELAVRLDCVIAQASCTNGLPRGPKSKAKIQGSA